jgi:hypothetical protein
MLDARPNKTAAARRNAVQFLILLGVNLGLTVETRPAAMHTMLVLEKVDSTATTDRI